MRVKIDETTRFWNNGEYRCSFPGCEFTSEFVLATVSHLESKHELQVEDCDSVLPYMLHYLRNRVDFELARTASKTDLECTNNVSMQIDHALDLELRMNSCQDNLKEILDQQKAEFEADFCEMCLFCSNHIEHLDAYFAHLYDAHNFSIGLLDNLVFYSRYLALLRTKLNGRQCIYCEKVFNDHITLRKHMRKKKHVKVNPSNPVYDCFYIKNYGFNTMVDIEDDVEVEDSGNEFEEWDDQVFSDTKCLYCIEKFKVPEDALMHMRLIHGVDLLGIRGLNEFELDYYTRIKYINYVRSETGQGRCWGCDFRTDSVSTLYEHLTSCEHELVVLPKYDTYYLFPAEEDDPLLMIDYGNDE
jgi:hypothetical protein